jgi:hypothetical protein
MAAVMDNNEAVSRRQGQREADTDSRRNNQIETMAAAVVAGGNVVIGHGIMAGNIAC